jgi:FkbM family methyltransferase
MSQPTQQSRARIDFSSLHSLADARFDAMDSFDEVYFIGDHSGSFALRARAIAHALPNFAGIAVFSVSPEKRTRIAQQLPVRTNWGFIELARLVERAATKKVLLVDFNDNLTGMNITRELARQGVTVRDYLFAMHQLNQVHTYQAVKEEREYVAANLGRFIALAERFGDECSRRTLHARLQAWLTMERRPLIEVSFPLNLFINDCAAQAGLVVGDDEVFIDAGAAHGDTVSQFFDLTRGRYRAMHAFEPDSANFAALRNLSGYLPNVTPYHAGLGEESTEIPFYESPDNRFGSNFKGDAAARVKTTMKIMKLDDVVDEASLIKIDVEGWEAQVLKGSARVIAGSKPNMTISAYHYAKDIPDILDTVDAIAPYRNVALRHHSPSLYDSQLVFSDRQAF